MCVSIYMCVFALLDLLGLAETSLLNHLNIRGIHNARESKKVNSTLEINRDLKQFIKKMEKETSM
jgi:hypothetical protein